MKEHSQLPTQFNIKISVKSLLDSSVLGHEGIDWSAGPVELISALSVSIHKEESTYQAFCSDVITGIRMTKALARFTDATKNSAVNSSVPRPTRLKQR